MNKFPGFIEGLKSGNINTNIISLISYSERINKILIEIIDTAKGLSNTEIMALKDSSSVISETINEDYTPDELLRSYIKFGNIFKSISLSIKDKCNMDDLKIIAKNYLFIAKYTKDSRIKNLAISIAKDIE